MATKPGINPNFEIYDFSPQERKVIYAFSRHCYITTPSKEIRDGNSCYRSFLMRPTESVAIALGVESEIIVLLAEYDSFEVRTLKAYESIIEQFDEKRVDSSVRVLISGDTRIQDSIRHYLAREPEYPIIIPFCFKDFTDASADMLFDKIRDNYLVRDLFAYQSPLKQEYFYFGRRRLVEGVIDRHKAGQNSGLFGLRKSGKTSTIYAIQRRARSSGCRTLFIDCEDPAVHAKRYGPLLAYIIREIRREFSLKKIDANFEGTPDIVSQEFRRLMDLSLSESGSDILLIFDEIENISPVTAASEHWSEEKDTLYFWQILRSYAQTTKKNKMTFCFVGTNPRLFEQPLLASVNSPVYLFVPKTYIPVLTLLESTKMIQRLGFFMGLQFDGEVAAHIHSRFGGHPFFIRQLCSQINKSVDLSRPRSVSIAICREAETLAAGEIQRYLGEILFSLLRFYVDEHAMLEYLARGDAKTFSELAAYDNSYVDHLLGYGLIVRRGAEYDFAFGAVAEAVRKSLNDETVPSLSDRWSEVTKRRNLIEQEIRMYLYRWSIDLEDHQWQVSFAKCLSSERRITYGGLTRREALSRGNSPLYFIELLKLIKATKVRSIGGEPISAITAAMGIVNAQRADAHAKEIAGADFIELREALDTLECAFVPPT